MEFLLARQPIFNRDLGVIAYELLYRTSNTNSIDVIDGEKATSSVLVNTLMTGDFSALTNDYPAFVNFTDQLILDEIPHILDPARIVIEILEDVHICEELIEAVKKLKEKGFRIALDDFVNTTYFDDLIPYVDIIKVDLLNILEEDLLDIVHRYKRPGISLLAEKVESMSEFQHVLALGFDYFQGFFFAKPVIVAGKDVKGFNANMMRVVDAMQKPEPDFKEIARIIECDISLTYKLLRVVNSAAYFKRNRINSVQQALTLLGIKELKKWIYLIVLREQNSDKPSELLLLSLVRAKFCEAVNMTLNRRKDASDSFMTGLLSLLDSMMDRSLEVLVKELPLEESIQNALLGEDNQLSQILKVVTAYEKADWEPFYQWAQQLSLDPLVVPTLYFDSLSWANEIVDSVKD
jgi:EAL and modified HD-GYP domain-containing signal transduction protein